MDTNDKKYLESLGAEYADLFNHIIDQGTSERRAIEMVKALPQQQIEYERKSTTINVQIQFEKDWLEENTDWGSSGKRGREQLLWQLGMDTKSNHYFEDSRRVLSNTGDGYKLVFKDVVWGAERLDSNWINKTYEVDAGMNYRHYASDAARTFVWNKRQGESTRYL